MTPGGPRFVPDSLEAVRRIAVLVFSVTAAALCFLTWRETRGLGDAIDRNRHAAPVFDEIQKRVQNIAEDVAEIKGRFKERDIESRGSDGGK